MNYIRHAVGIVGVTLLTLTTLLFLCGYGASISWVLEMFTHGRLIYLALFALSFALLLLSNYRKLAIVAVALLLIASVDVVKFWFSPSSSGAATPAIRITQMNLWGGKNRQFQEAFAIARRGNPDVIALSEVTMPWWLRFVKEFPDYPYQVVEPRFGGVGILSRLPINSAQVRYFGRKNRPRICAEMTTRQGTKFDLIFVHTVTPFYLPPMRDGELEVVASEARSSKNPVILLGDINCSPWSPVFSKLVQQSGLVDSEQGFGIQPSWAPHIVPFGIIPIDHAFVSKNIEVLSRTISSTYGSDHRAVTVECSLQR